MTTTIIGTTIVISLDGRIDSSNVADTEAAIDRVLQERSGLEPAFDADKLTYISSAGLRLLLKKAKAAGKKLLIKNVSREVYEIFETTGFTSILTVEKKLRSISVDGCPLIGSGGYGKVYRIDPETIAKIYLPGISLEMVQREREVAQKAFLLGVPTAISYDVVQCGDSYGLVFELLNAETVAQIMDAAPDRVEEMGKRSALLLNELHAISLVDAPDFPDRKKELLSAYEKAAPFITSEESEEILTFIKNIPQKQNFLHGDFNSKNVMVQGNDFLLIDIGDAAFGHPVFDLAGLVLAYQYLPASSMPEAERYRLMGFHLEDAPRMLNAMLQSYFSLAPDDKEGLKACLASLAPYSQLLACYHGLRRSNFNPEYIEKIMTGSIRTRLLPAIRNVPPLEW